MCSECELGHIAHALWRIKSMFILTAILFLIVIICGIISDVIDGSWAGFRWFIITYHWLYIMALLGAGVNSSLIAISAYKACAPTRCKLAEEIFHLLGMKM